MSQNILEDVNSEKRLLKKNRRTDQFNYEG